MYQQNGWILIPQKVLSINYVVFINCNIRLYLLLLVSCEYE